MGKLTGKVALITGAGSGIGQATAQLFAKEGAKVAAVDLNLKGAQATVASIGPDGEAIAIAADVTKAADAQQMVAQTVARFGRLDILYNNAGITGAGLLHEMSEESWDRMLAVNLKGVFLGCKYALPELMKRGGVVLCTSSAAGIEAISHEPSYCASKAGAILLIKTIALDYAEYGIRANCICPGGVDTPMARSMIGHLPQSQQDEMMKLGAKMHLLNRFATAHEIAQTALFLASDDSSFITGTTILVDGGMTLGRRPPQ